MGSELNLHTFLISALEGEDFSFRLLLLYPRRKSTWYLLILGCVGPRARLDAVTKRK